MEKEKILILLSTHLINDLYPFSKIGSGELETTYGIHLEEIDRTEYRFIKHKPHDIHDKNWIKKTALVWGSNTGWDINSEGTIALCRVDYDDYINFKIHYLSEEEIEQYRHEKLNSDNLDPAHRLLLQKFSMIKKLLDDGLITDEEYNKKRIKLLEEI